MHAATKNIIFALCILTRFIGWSQETPPPTSTPSTQPPTVVPTLPQEVGKGYIQLINATGHEGSLLLWVNDESLSSRGYASGKSTGPLPLAESAVKIKGLLGELEEAELGLTVKTNHLHLVVARVVMEEKKGKPAMPKLVLQTTEFAPGISPPPSALLILQLTDVPVLDVSLGGGAVSLAYGKPQILEISSRIGVFPRLVFRNTTIESFNFRDPAHRAVILFTDKAGGLRSAAFSTLLP
jgi:hypothetical protein